MSFVALWVFGSFALYGCSTQQSSPANVAQSFCNAIHNGNLQSAAKYTADPKIIYFGIQTNLDKSTASTIFSRDQFVIKSSTVKGKKAYVVIRITAPNLSRLLPEISQQTMTSAMGGHYSIKQIQDFENQIKKCPSYTQNVVLTMTKRGNQWKVASGNNEFRATILGVSAPIIKP